MKPGFVDKYYRELLRSTYNYTLEKSEDALWHGRVLALPLGAFLFVTIPLSKLLSTIEAFFFTLANLFAPLFPEYCSFYDCRVSIKIFFYFLVGTLISPFIACFVAVAVITTMLLNPIKASTRFLSESVK